LSYKLLHLITFPLSGTDNAHAPCHVTIQYNEITPIVTCTFSVTAVTCCMLYAVSYQSINQSLYY